MKCAHCASEMTGRKRKYCNRECGNAAYLAGPKPPCSEPGCENPRNGAKGLCKTHYNRTLPNRHRTITKKCDTCGRDCIKYDQAQRYANTFCSLLCRDYFRYGPTSSSYPLKRPQASAKRKREPVQPTLPGTLVAGNCFDCGEAFVAITTTGQAKYCSERCERRVSARRRRAREHSSFGEYTYTQVARLYIAQGRTCAYCQRPASGLPEPEHVIPLSRGGRNDTRNLVAACHLCNADKGDMTPSEWQQDRARRGLPPVTIDGPAFAHLAAAEATGTPHRLSYWAAA